MKLLTSLLLEDGQGMTEYALILVVVVLAAVAGLASTGTNLQTFYYDRFKTEMDLIMR